MANRAKRFIVHGHEDGDVASDLAGVVGLTSTRVVSARIRVVQLRGSQANTAVWSHTRVVFTRSAFPGSWTRQREEGLEKGSEHRWPFTIVG